MFRKISLAATLVTLLTLGTAGATFAAGNPSGTGQPNANCETQTTGPAGFGSGGFAQASSVYAGSGSGSAHAGSSSAVSQYDVACYQLSN